MLLHAYHVAITISMKTSACHPVLMVTMKILQQDNAHNAFPSVQHVMMQTPVQVAWAGIFTMENALIHVPMVSTMEVVQDLAHVLNVHIHVIFALRLANV